MSTYEELKGLKVKYLSSDTSGDRIQEGEVFYNSSDFNLKSFVSSVAWHSSAPLITARSSLGGVGTPSAGLAFGGGPGTSNATEEYNGSGWATSGDMSTARRELGSAGIQTAGLAFGGENPTSNATEEYDGSSWTNGGDLPAATAQNAGFGTQTAGVSAGGNPSGTSVNTTVEYNGSAWTGGGNLLTPVRYVSGAGTLTSGIVALGYNDSTPGSFGANQNYDGTNWTAGHNLNTNRFNGAMSGPSNSDALAFGGSPYRAIVEQYNGSSWSEIADLSAGKTSMAATLATPTTGALVFGGLLPALSATTEELTTSVSATTGAAWASGGNMPTTKLNGGQGIGTELAAAVFGGNQTTITYPYVNTTYEYDGSSWGSGGNMNNTGSSHGAFGTQTAGTKIGSYMYPPNVSTTNVEEYDGSSWTAKPAMSQTRYGAGGAGISTAGLAMGGTAKAPVVALTAVEHYDGEGWTSGGALPAHHENFASGGTQTAAIVAGGQDPAPQSNGASVTSYDYNGSSWTSNPNMSIDKVYNFGNGGPVSQTSFLSATGNTGPGTASNNCELFDGTSWATAASVSTARSQHMNAQHGTTGTNGALIAGGRPPPTGVNTSEVFTAETTAARAVKTIDFD